MKNFIIIAIISCFSINLFAEVNYKRNPFESLVNQKISNYQVVNSNKNTVKENLPLIRRYDLSKYDVTGLIQSRTKEIILVTEKYSGKKFFLKKLDFIGNQDEQIIKVERNKIILGKFEPSLNKYVETNFIVINRKK